MNTRISRLGCRVLDRCLQKTTKTTYKGIRLCDNNCDRSDDQDFISWTKEALDLIETSDLRRFRRVQKEVRYIVNIELHSGGMYMRSVKACDVDFGRYRSITHREWALHSYAATIVHEATHGFLFSRGHEYTPENREQVERICHDEGIRFLLRAKPEWKDFLDKHYGFDPKRWQLLWTGSFWDKTLVLLKRIRESKHHGKQRPV